MSFNQVKSHILIMESLPDVKIVFYFVSWEESNQKHDSFSGLFNKSQSSSAFAGKLNDTKGINQNIFYKNYGLKGHSIKKCYKLMAYPKDFKPRSEVNRTSFAVGNPPC